MEDAHFGNKGSVAYGEAFQRLKPMVRYTLPITQRQYNGYTTATTITDGRLVWTVFGNRVATCFDMEGKRKWSRVLPDNPQMMWGHSASPLLIAGRLIVPIEDIVALKANLLDRQQQVITCLTEKLLIYASGRLLEPTDRREVDRITTELKARGNRLRDLIKLIARSNVFLAPPL